MSEWTLQSREAKRLFVMGLAALAVRGESGPGDPANCADLASKFGAYSDFVWFTAARSSPKDFSKLLRGLGKDEFIKAFQDAIIYNDPYLPALMEEAKRRKLDPQTTSIPIQGQNLSNKRKFSFDD